MVTLEPHEFGSGQANWGPEHIAHLASVSPDNTLTERIVIDGTTKGTPTYNAIETFLPMIGQVELG